MVKSIYEKAEVKMLSIKNIFSNRILVSVPILLVPSLVEAADKMNRGLDKLFITCI